MAGLVTDEAKLDKCTAGACWKGRGAEGGHQDWGDVFPLRHLAPESPDQIPQLCILGLNGLDLCVEGTSRLKGPANPKQTCQGIPATGAHIHIHLKGPSEWGPSSLHYCGCAQAGLTSGNSPPSTAGNESRALWIMAGTVPAQPTCPTGKPEAGEPRGAVRGSHSAGLHRAPVPQRTVVLVHLVAPLPEPLHHQGLRLPALLRRLPAAPKCRPY